MIVTIAGLTAVIIPVAPFVIVVIVNARSAWSTPACQRVIVIAGPLASVSRIACVRDWAKAVNLRGGLAPSRRTVGSAYSACPFACGFQAVPIVKPSQANQFAMNSGALRCGRDLGITVALSRAPRRPERFERATLPRLRADGNPRLSVQGRSRTVVQARGSQRGARAGSSDRGERRPSPRVRSRSSAENCRRGDIRVGKEP